MWVIKYKWLFFVFSGVLIAGSVFALLRFGLNLGTDFTGGTILEVEYAVERPEITLVRQEIAKLNLGEISIQESGEQAYLLRSRDLTTEEHHVLFQSLERLSGVDNPLTEKRFSSVGPALGAELARKGLIAIAVVVVLIIIYIAFVFRRVQSSWKYGLIAIVALAHDTIIPTGVFALLGHYYGVEIDALFLTALLTILGLSVNDTIVVFDRIRENLQTSGSETFAETVGRSLREVFGRSINTSLTVVLVLLAILFYGGESTRHFALAMSIGMIVGTYSSIFLASPLLVVWEARRNKNPNRA